jgi:hypothetical protein
MRKPFLLILEYSVWSQVLQKKQQDSKKLASLSIQNEKRASELEHNVDHLKYQKVQLQRRLREEGEKKKQLDAEIKRDQQKIKVILSIVPAKHCVKRSGLRPGRPVQCLLPRLFLSTVLTHQKLGLATQ